MLQLASLTNDNEIECISALLRDQTDMTNKSRWSFWILVSVYYAHSLPNGWLFSRRFLTGFVIYIEEYS